MLNWRSSSAYALGASHLEWGTPCQDRAVHIELNGTNIIVLADGAGSYEFSHLGAEVVVTKLSVYLGERFEQLQQLTDEQMAEEIHSFLLDQLNLLVFEHDRNMDEFSSTLLFVATKGDEYIAGHVGDGLIVKKEQGDIHILSVPENGRYENETYFVTMPHLGEHFRIYRGQVSTDSAFVLMSDGSTASFYSSVEGLEAENLAVIMEHFQTATDNTFYEDLTDLLGVLVENTEDDCSIAVLVASDEEPVAFIPSALAVAAPVAVVEEAVEEEPAIDVDALLSTTRAYEDEDEDDEDAAFSFDDEDELDDYDEDEDDAEDDIVYEAHFEDEALSSVEADSIIEDDIAYEDDAADTDEVSSEVEQAATKADDEHAVAPVVQEVAQAEDTAPATLDEEPTREEDVAEQPNDEARDETLAADDAQAEEADKLTTTDTDDTSSK